MICPKCKSEYRSGFAVCTDCEVPLVESTELAAGRVLDRVPDDGSERETFAGEPAAGAPGDPNTDPFCSFWKGTDLRVCTEICSVLDEAGIPHKTIRRQDHLFNLINQSPYEVGVPASMYEKAELAIQDAFGPDEDSGEEAVRLLPPPEEDPRTQTFRSLWVGDSMYECAGLCRELKVAGIYYRVDQRRRQSGGRGIGERYEIGVPEADYERAKAITGGVEPNIVGEVEDPEIVESLDDGVDSGSASPTTRVREEDWHREDATSLAWEGEPADSRHMIEMSLKENDIPMRWDTQDGKPKLFVLPEDEEHAKEIVQEILEGQPPE